jgi:hypothetical protein
MYRNLARNFVPNRGWKCDSQWQYSPTHFRLEIPLLHAYTADTQYLIDSINVNKYDIELYGRLIEESPNKNIGTLYNGKTGR